MATLTTDVLVIGSGAGGAVTAARLSAAGRDVIVVEEGPWVDADSVEPFSLE
jgi:choline dehydrogenase-like flavoprotein